jgi:putative DNA primase/helicase
MTVQLKRASTITPEQVDYLHEPLIPLRVVTLMVGVDGVGKSTVLYTMAGAATRGRMHGNFRRTPVDVVIASSEDHPASVIVPRLIAAGADLDRVHVVKVRRDGLEGDISLPEDIAALERETKRVHAKLLMVDPLVAHLPIQIDSHKAQHVRQVLAPLAHLAEDAQLAVVAVVHFNGSQSADVRSRISGSKALRDASRSVIVCGRDPEDQSQFVMVQDKNSFGPRPTTGHCYEIEEAVVERDGVTFKTSKIRWGERIEIDAPAMLAPAPKERGTPKLDAAKDMLNEMLAAGPQLRLDIEIEAKHRDISWRTVMTAKAELKIADRQEHEEGKRGAGPSVWFMPDRSGVQSTGVQSPTAPTDCRPNPSPEASNHAASDAPKPSGVQHSDAATHLTDDAAISLFQTEFNAVRVN